VPPIVVESHLESLCDDIRPNQKDNHRDRAPQLAAVERERHEQDRPHRERSGICKRRNAERDVVEPRSLKAEEALDRPAISPCRRRKPVGHHEHDDKPCPTQSREEKKPFPIPRHHA